MKTFDILIYPKAQSDLKEIKNYFENTLYVSVETFMDKLLGFFEILRSNPFVHQLVNDEVLSQKGYRFFKVENYLVFYVVLENEVQVRRIIYGRRNYSDIL